MTNTNHFEQIRNWASDRNLIAGSDSFRQMTKLVEEMKEMVAGMAEDHDADVMDGVGDSVVVLTIMAAQQGFRIEEVIGEGRTLVIDNVMIDLFIALGSLAHGLAKGREDEIRKSMGDIYWLLYFVCDAGRFTIEQCMAMAWDEIKDRKGRMVDGIFIKNGRTSQH